MPQATSARTTDRDRLKSRPSVAARGAITETAPVLFRLPVIVQPTAAEGAAKPLRHAASEASGDAAATNLPPVSASLQVSSPSAGSATSGSVASGASMAGASPVAKSAAAGAASAGATAAAAQAALAGGDMAATVSFPKMPPAPAVAAVEAYDVGNGVPHHAPATRAAQPAVLSSPAVHRSWWEHWSSGVVLILLIIALVTASILALNDGGKSNKEQLASDSVSAALDDFDLSNITIPDIAVRKAEPAEEIEPAVGGSSAESPAVKTETALAGISSENPIKKTDQGSEGPDAISKLATSNEAMSVESSGAMASLAPPANANLAAEPIKSPAKSANKSADATSPLASLALPMGVSPAPLFDAQSSLAAEPVPTASGSIPGSAAIAVNAPKHSGATASAEKTTTPPAAASGASPQLYDGAGLGTELHATRVETADSNTRSSGPVDTNLPSYATILASATQPVIDGSASPAQAGTADPHAGPGIATTATPELDTQAIINAYLPYSQTNKANNGAATNRFAPAYGNPAAGGGVPAAGQPPASVPAAQPGSRGFTLGN